MSWIYVTEYKEKRNGAGTGDGGGVGLGCGYQAGNIMCATINICRIYGDGSGSSYEYGIFKDSRWNNLRINKRLCRQYSYILYDDIIIECTMDKVHG